LKDQRTIVVADHHETVFVCQVLDRGTVEVRSLTLEGRRDVLRPILEALPRPALVYVEACRSWEWVSNLRDELAIDLQLVDPSRMPENARSSKKTDHHDVAAMVHRLTVTGELPSSCRARRERTRGALSRLAWLALECLLLQYDQNLALQELLEGEIVALVKDRKDYRRLLKIPRHRTGARGHDPRGVRRDRALQERA
jgi:hypothetical protein